MAFKNENERLGRRHGNVALEKSEVRMTVHTTDIELNHE